MPNTNGGWGDVDEGGWGGAWGDIVAAAEPATKINAGKNGHGQPQAQTHNKDKNAKKEKKAKFQNDSKKNTDDHWGTNAGGWGGGGGWADEAPAAPTAADNDSKTANNAADDNAWGNGWDADDPWAQRDDAPDEPAAPANKEVSLPLKRTLKESSHYPTRSDPDKKYTDSYISPATIPFPTPVVPSPAMPYYSSPHYSQNYISHHHRRSSPVTIYSPPPYIQSWPSPSPPPLLHHPDRQTISYGLQSHAPNMYGNGGYRGDRPYEWRRDFSTRSGLSWLVPRSQNSFSRADFPRPYLHPFLRYSHNHPPVILDLRFPPRNLVFRDVARPVISSDLSRFASEPPVPHLRLYHRRLPWYIDVYASNATGVTLFDLFESIWACLRKPVRESDFWNEDLDDADRDKIDWAWRERVGNDRREIERGVRRVDYLRRCCVFEGLVRGKHGMWEMKLKKGAGY